MAAARNLTRFAKEPKEGMHAAKIFSTPHLAVDSVLVAEMQSTRATKNKS